MVLRWGGEEFLVYSQGVTQDQRPLLVGRILDAIAATPITLEDGTALRISATAGAVSLPFAPDGDGTRPEATVQPDWEQEIALADRALYKGKEAGRNRGYIVAGLRRPEGGLELDLVLPGVAA
jgi:GGDEF domain-containing protein